MKLNLWILLFVLFFVHQVSSAAIIIKHSHPKAQEIVDELNKERALFAKQANISNMHELKYEIELEKKAESMSNCNFQEGPYATIPSTDSDKWNKMAAKLAMHPLQTFVGCSEIDKKCVENGITIDGICLMGPYSRLNGSDLKKGAPGSHCPGGKKNFFFNLIEK
ncbi:unnamed protein product [Caenorhabditis brenneri]